MLFFNYVMFELFCRKIYGKNYIEYYYQQIEEEWISRFSWEGEGSVQKGRSPGHSYCQARLVPRCQEQRVCRHLSTLSLNINNIWLLLQDFFLQPKLVIQWWTDFKVKIWAFFLKPIYLLYKISCEKVAEISTILGNVHVEMILRTTLALLSEVPYTK